MSLLLRPQLKATDKDLHHRDLALFCLVLMQALLLQRMVVPLQSECTISFGEVPHLGNI